MSKLVTCSKCNGKKQVTNPEYERELDRQMDLAPSGDIAETRTRRKYSEFIDCKECNGTGQVTCNHPRSEKE